MKKWLIALLLPAAAALAAESSTTTKTTAAEEAAQIQQEYAKFLAEIVKPENVTDLVAVMDRLIEEGEHGLVDKQPDPGLVEGATKTGLRIQFSTTDIKQAIVYHLVISRGGALLRYDEATKFASFFTDRAGLPHPLDIVEGDNSTFTIRWLIKPSEWKKFLNQMQKTRAANRAEKNLAKAFVAAVEREIEARAQVQRNR